MTTQVASVVGPQAQKSLLTIQKATVKKQLLNAEFSEQLDIQSKPREFTMQGTELVHPDLEHYFAQLVPHFCLLTEQLDEHHQYPGNTDNSGYWPVPGDELPAHFDSYGVTGIILSKKNGATLMGFRTLESGKVLNMTGQYVSFEAVSEEDEEETDIWRYDHAGRFETAVLDAINEVEQALRGKCSEAGRQLDMFHEPQVGEIEMGEAMQEKPATPRKAKRTE